MTKRLAYVALAFALGVFVRVPTFVKIYSPSLHFFDSPLEAAYIPSVVKSVTAISISVNGNAGTQTVSVTKANSLLLGNSSIQAGQFNECTPYGVITNNTTITATANGGAGCGTQTYKATLFEFIGNFVKSSGSGSITTSSGSGTATITSVNTSKTILAWTGESTTSGTSLVGDQTAIVLTNATTITATSTAANAYIAGYSYVEFR